LTPQTTHSHMKLSFAQVLLLSGAAAKGYFDFSSTDVAELD